MFSSSSYLEPTVTLCVSIVVIPFKTNHSAFAAQWSSDHHIVASWGTNIYIISFFSQYHIACSIFLRLFIIFFFLRLSLEKKIMEASSASNWFLLCVLLSLSLKLTHCNVSYDNKALIVNGQRKILFSGSIHYPRSTPQVLNFLNPCFLFYFIFFAVPISRFLREKTT